MFCDAWNKGDVLWTGARKDGADDVKIAYAVLSLMRMNSLLFFLMAGSIA